MILLKNGRVVDGSLKEPYLADILIKGDRIAAIGSIPREKADTVIDCMGIACVTPGIIDIQTNSDHYLTLFTHPDQSDFVHQGVTTIIGGHCGASLAPLLTGSLESIRKWGDPDSLNVDWHSLKEFFRVLKRRPLGVNFGTLVGHATIRRALTRNENRNLSRQKLKLFRTLLEEGLEEGAFGLSTGLGYSESARTPYDELKALVKAIKSAGGIYATHLRNETEHLKKSYEETEKIADETGARVMIEHLQPLRGYEEQFQTVLERIGARKEEDLWFTISPFDTSVIPMYMLLPEWAKRGGFEDMLRAMRMLRNEKRILEAWKDLETDDMTIVKAPHHTFLTGKTIAEVAKSRDEKPARTLLDLMKITRMRALILMKNATSARIEEALVHPRAIPASQSAAFPQKSPAMARLPHATQTFSHFLTVAQSKGIPFERAIERITSLPARLMGIRSRGEIKKGNFADLVIWKDAAVSTVIVNGVATLSEGKITGAHPGYALRKNDE